MYSDVFAVNMRLLACWEKVFSFQLSLRFIRALTQERRRWLRKRHLKSEYALLQSLSRLFRLVQFGLTFGRISGVEFQDCIKVPEKRKERRFLVFTFLTKREIKHLHFVVVQLRQRSVKKSVMCA